MNRNDDTLIPFRKPDKSVRHAVLGRSVKNGRTDTCSRCGHSIPDDHVPLMLWDNTGDLMWVYCEACESPMFAEATAS